MAAGTGVLLVDDRVGDITWLIDLVEKCGYDVDVVGNEADARLKLASLKENGATPYALAIIDIMVSGKDIMDLVHLDEEFYTESRNSGIRLCRFVRKDLEISSEDLPIVCITARADHEEVRVELEPLGIPLFCRVPQSSEEDLREHLDEYLEPL